MNLPTIIICVILVIVIYIGIRSTKKRATSGCCGSSETVKKLSGQGATKRRIMDMGITKGVSVTVQKVAPLGDPIELTVRGYQLSIRKADAEMVEVE